MAVLLVWLTVLGVLGASLPLSAGIELSKLYGHMEAQRLKRSGEFTQISSNRPRGQNK